MLTTKKADIRLVEQGTGEVIGQGQFLYLEHRPAKIKEKFVMSFHEGNALLAKADLSRNAHKVLHAMLARLNFENYILLTTSEIAGMTGITRNNVTRHINELLTEGIITKGPKHDRTNTYRLSHIYAWKGSAKQLTAHRISSLKLVPSRPQP